MAEATFPNGDALGRVIRWVAWAFRRSFSTLNAQRTSSESVFVLGRVVAARASQSMELRQRLIMIGAATIRPSTRTIAVLIQTPEFRLLSSTSHPPCRACS